MSQQIAGQADELVSVASPLADFSGPVTEAGALERWGVRPSDQLEIREVR